MSPHRLPFSEPVNYDLSQNNQAMRSASIVTRQSDIATKGRTAGGRGR